MRLIKTDQEIGLMRQAGRILKKVFIMISENMKIGASGSDLDKQVYQIIKEEGGKPSFLNYQIESAPPYPATICVSKNNGIVHGIPNDDKFKNGDVISVDIGVSYNGLHVDAARTYILGEADIFIKKLVVATEEALKKAIAIIKPGILVGDVSSLIGSYITQAGFWPVPELAGHGVGHNLHEEPIIPNSGNPGKGMALESGMTIALEPIVTLRPTKITMKKDLWSIESDALDNIAAHFEDTVLITKDGFEVLT